MRNLTFTDESWSDYVYWQTQDRKTLKRINDLIKDTQRGPFAGIGKPEPLKHSLSGCWSRRIDETNGSSTCSSMMTCASSPAATIIERVTPMLSCATVIERNQLFRLR